MTVPQFFTPDVKPQLQGGQMPQVQYPDLGGDFIRAFFNTQDQNTKRSISSAENDIRKQELAVQQQHFKLLQEEERTKQAHLAHQQEITNQVGTGYNAFLEHLLPHAAATGQLGQMLGGQQQPQGQPPQQQGIPQGLPWQQAQGQISGLPQQPQSPLAPAPQSTPSPPPAPQGPGGRPDRTMDPFEALAQVLPSMSPEAVPILMQHIAPIIGQFQKGGPNGSNALEQADSGKYKTVFDKTKGYWNPDTKQWQPELPKGYTTEELAKQATDRQDRLDRQAALDSYRTEIQGNAASRQFDTATKPLRDRAAMLQQAVMTVHQAQFASDPEQRRILTSTALLNFVQASDQKVNLRYQMVKFVKDNIDPSFSGKWENAVNLLSTGQYPNKVYTALETHLNSLLNQSRGEFEKMRAGEIKRRPELDNYLRQPDDIFGSAPGAQPPGGGVIPPPP